MPDKDTSEAAGGSTLFKYRFGNAELDEARGELRVDGELVALEPRPFALLLELLRRPGEVITKEELFLSVWAGQPTVDNVLANAVGKLRKLLRDADASLIVNLPRVGYRLTGRVERLAASMRSPGPLALVAGQPVPGRESYLLEAPLGSGGQHDVWRARHAKLGDPRVFKFAADGERLTALKREYTLYRVLKEALGERDDFARVLDANLAQLPFYLECEYGGQDLSAWAAGGALETLDGAQRLALFLQIAQTVADAHNVGVLHKDLKPSNVLIEPRGERWHTRLTDFGSGRLLDAGRLEALRVTALGLTLTQGVTTDSHSGTLLYLAPELLAGKAPSVQSDLYALGLMLFQLLVGDFTRPITPGWEKEIADHLLRSDIESATQSQPTGRLRGVAELLERLRSLDERRHAEKEQQAVLAGIAAAEEKLRTVRARRPWMLALVGSLTVGLSISLGLYLRAEKASELARAEAARSTALSDFLTKDMLQAIDITRADSARKLTLLDALAKASERVPERFKDQLPMQAAVRYELGSMYHQLFAWPQAESELVAATKLYAQSTGPENEQALTAQFRLARLFAQRNRLEEATRLLANATRLAGDRMAQASPLKLMAERAQFQLALASQRYAEASTWAGRMNQTVETVEPGNAALRFILKTSQVETQYRLGEFAEASASCSRILSAPYSAKAVGPVVWARQMINCARVDVAMKNNQTAEDRLTAGRDSLSAMLGPTEYYVAVANSELATLYTSQGQFLKARPLTVAVHESLQQTLGEAQQATWIAAADVAAQTLYAGEAGAALDRFGVIRAWFLRTQGDATSPVVQGIDYFRAWCLLDLHRPVEALALLQALKPEALAAASPAPDWRWRLNGLLGRALIDLGRDDEGLKILRPALDEMQKAGTPSWIRDALLRVAKAAETKGH